MRTISRFSSDEDQAMTALRIEGRSLGEIARKLARAKSSVQMRLVSLAKQQEAAHD